jgi:hypothetical protein
MKRNAKRCRRTPYHFRGGPFDGQVGGLTAGSQSKRSTLPFRLRGWFGYYSLDVHGNILYWNPL